MQIGKKCRQKWTVPKAKTCCLICYEWWLCQKTTADSENLERKLCLRALEFIMQCLARHNPSMSLSTYRYYAPWCNNFYTYAISRLAGPKKRGLLRNCIYCVVVPILNVPNPILGAHHQTGWEHNTTLANKLQQFQLNSQKCWGTIHGFHKRVIPCQAFKWLCRHRLRFPSFSYD